MKITLIILLNVLISGKLLNHEEPVKQPCEAFNSVVDIYNDGIKDNRELNELVPIIESHTKIEASCERGAYGYYYSDSILRKDILLWKEILELECDSVKVIR